MIPIVALLLLILVPLVAVEEVDRALGPGALRRLLFAAAGSPGKAESAVPRMRQDRADEPESDSEEAMRHARLIV